MAIENIRKFYAILSENEGMVKKLGEFGKEYSKPGVTEEQKVEYVEKYVLPMAAETGCDFTVQELKAFEVEQVEELKKNGELSEDELDGVAGGIGIGYCLGIGAGFNIHFGGYCVFIGASLT